MIATNQVVGLLRGRGRNKKMILKEREKNRGTSVRSKAAIDTAIELKRKVDLEEKKFAYQKTENIMVNIQMQISAVREHVTTTVEMIKHGAPTTLANWNMVSDLNLEMEELRGKLKLIQSEMEKEEKEEEVIESDKK